MLMMKRLFLVLMVSVLSLGVAQSKPKDALEVCRTIFPTLSPQGVYFDERNVEPRLAHVVLSNGAGVVSQFTLDGSLNLVQVGLEGVSETFPATQNLRERAKLRLKIHRLFPRLRLANWAIKTDSGFRCFVVMGGKIFGNIDLSPTLKLVLDRNSESGYQNASEKISLFARP